MSERQSRHEIRTPRCGTEAVSETVAKHLELNLQQFDLTARRAMIERTGGSTRSGSNERTGGSVTVTVYFHIISKGLAIQDGNVPDAMIQAQIDELNKAYSGAHSSGATNTPFRFVLAGTDRTVDASWFTMEKGSKAEVAAKTKLRKAGAANLNIYTANPQQDLGWSTYPWDYSKKGLNDGVVVRFTTLPGGTENHYNEGRSIVHETGHWLGLYHTFQGGCTYPNDYATDTPAEASASFACPTGQDSCAGEEFPGLDPIDNFMDYTDDSCMVRFSAEQSKRMDAMSLKYRTIVSSNSFH
ncbi:MAG TPA: zinc metalloprotease [Terriglobales bacterium]|nr:zinc metalloprotease [Terriglobales bacterium]